jgi:hypothetical protein
LKIVAFVCTCCSRTRLRFKSGPPPMFCRACRPNGSCEVLDRKKQKCKNCANEFSGDKAKYCSKKCREQWHHNNGAIAPHRCKTCNTVFHHRTEKTFCGDECRTRAWSRTCKDCGVHFTQKKNCSGKCKACRKHDRNRASSIRLRVRRGKAVTAVSKISVHDCWSRDNGKCQICMKKIDLAVRWPNRNSMSVDHIVPLSKGGTDEAANVRAAHLGCNSRRGNKQGVQKRLF